MASTSRTFALAAALNLGFVVLEVAVSQWAHSAALLADAGHNAIDGLGLLAVWAALWLGRLSPTPRLTYGLKAASSLAALANAGALLVMVLFLVRDSISRLALPEPSAGGWVLTVALTGAVVNGGCAMLLARGQEKDINRRVAVLHMLADLLVSAAVSLSGLIGMLTGWLWVDPLCSLGVSLFLAFVAAKLLSEALHLAMAGVPSQIDPVEVQDFLASLPGVADVHDLHIWSIGAVEIGLTCHLVIPNGHPGDAFISDTGSKLDRKFGIGHPTLQVEISDAPASALLAV